MGPFDSGPSQLGDSDNPKDLVPGEPGRIASTVTTMHKLAAGIDQASASFVKIDEGRWQGPAGDAFRATFHQEVPNWRNSAEAFDKATKALEDHGHALQAAQQKAAEAITRYKKAQQATENARNQYNAAVDQHNAQAAQGAQVPAMAQFSDPGASDRVEAQASLDDARKMVRQSAAAAGAAIGAARDSAPQGPGLLERIAGDTEDMVGSLWNVQSHLRDGVMNSLGDMVKPLLGTAANPLQWTHPTRIVANTSSMIAGLVHSATHPAQLVKGFINYDEWGKDPAAAAGGVAVNVGSLFTGGEGMAAKGAGIAEKGAEASSTVGKVAEQAPKDLPSGTPPWHAPEAEPRPFSQHEIPDDGKPFGPQGSQPAFSGDIHEPPPPVRGSYTPPDHLLDHPEALDGRSSWLDDPGAPHEPPPHDPGPAHDPPQDHQPHDPSPDHHPGQPVDHPRPLDPAFLERTQGEIERLESQQDEFRNVSADELERMTPAERADFHSRARQVARELFEKQDILRKAGRL
jgi:uncharacterized protein YukE